MLLLVASLALAAALVRADMFDVVQPGRAGGPACQDGCARWASLAEDGYTGEISQQQANELWAGGQAAAAAAGSSCAQPANTCTVAWPPYPREAPGTVGAFCFCANSTQWATCVPQPAVPEQINLQLGSPSDVVISFVTFHEPWDGVGPGTAIPRPVAALELVSAGGGSAPTMATGVTHRYTNPSVDPGNPHDQYWNTTSRHYSMHFVPLKGLLPKPAVYRYRVKSGSANAVWSHTFEFRMPPPAPSASTLTNSSATTRVAIFGDMGVFKWNNMANLEALMGTRTGGGAAAEGGIDAVVHAGDHAYNLDQGDDRRGDGYLNAYERVLAHVPWLPVIGNHGPCHRNHPDLNPLPQLAQPINPTF